MPLRPPLLVGQECRYETDERVAVRLIGLALVAPVALLAERLLGMVLVFVALDRMSPRKIAFNLARAAVETVVAVAVYRVVLAVKSPWQELNAHIWRGNVTIRTEPYSRATRYLRQAVMVLLRETGF